MKPFKTLLTTFGLTLTFCFAFGQNKFPKPDFKEVPIAGYVVTLNNDTIKCEFKKPALGQLKYRPLNSTEKFIKPSIEKLKGYYSTFDSTTYEALFIDSGAYSPEFLKRRETGEINLYEQDITNPGMFMNGYYSGGGTTVYYYVNKDNSVLKEIKSNNLNIGGESRKKRKAYLLGLFADDPGLAKQFEDEQNYDVKTLRHYIHDYNVFKSSVTANK